MAVGGGIGVDRAQFWAMVEAARPTGDVDGQGCQQHTARLIAALRKLPADELLAVERIRQELQLEAYSWDLWGAAHLLGGGGCSDSGFIEFRGWLLAQGRAAWEGALRDPDSLATHPQVRGLPLAQRWWGGWFACEEMLYAADETYRQQTGDELPLEQIPVGPLPPEPRGERWDPDDDEQLLRRYPRLFAWLHAAPPP
jgi:hypothetical protein